MWLRRIFYAVLIVAAFLYYIFHTGYFSFLLLIVAFTIPVLSVFLTLLLRNGFRTELVCTTDENNVSNNFFVHLRFVPSNPATSVRLRLRIENLFSGDITFHNLSFAPKDRGKALISFESKLCGVIRCETKHLRMMDLLGLFFLPVRKPNPTELLILPKEIPFPALPIDWTSGENEISKDPSASGEREFCDIRPYRPGDSLRDVHWKLTARLHSPIVREYGTLIDSSTVVAVLWAGKSSRLCNTLGHILGAARLFMEEDKHVPFIWIDSKYDEATLHRYSCLDEKALSNIARRILSTPPSSDVTAMSDLLFANIEANQKIILLTDQGISLYWGTQKEAVI